MGSSYGAGVSPMSGYGSNYGGNNNNYFDPESYYSTSGTYGSYGMPIKQRLGYMNNNYGGGYSSSSSNLGYPSGMF